MQLSKVWNWNWNPYEVLSSFREKIDGAKALWQTRNDMIFEKDGSHQYRFGNEISKTCITEHSGNSQGNTLN